MKPFETQRKDNQAHRKPHECPPGSETHHAVPGGKDPKPGPIPEPQPEPELPPAARVKHVRVNTAQQGSHKRNWWQLGFNVASTVALGALGLSHLTPTVQKLAGTHENGAQATISAPANPAPSATILRLQGQISELQAQVETTHDRIPTGIKKKVDRNARAIKKLRSQFAEMERQEEMILGWMERKVSRLEQEQDERRRRLAVYERRQ